MPERTYANPWHGDEKDQRFWPMEEIHSKMIHAGAKVAWLADNGCISIDMSHLDPEHKKAAVGYASAIADLQIQDNKRCGLYR